MSIEDLAVRWAVFFSAAFAGVLGLKALRGRVPAWLYPGLWISLVVGLLFVAVWFVRPMATSPGAVLAMTFPPIVVGMLAGIGFGEALAWYLSGGQRTDELPEHPQLDRPQAARKRGDVAEAERLLREAIAGRRDHLDARAELGDLLAEAGRPEEAAGEFAAAAKLAREPDRAVRLAFRAAELWERAGKRGLAAGVLGELADRVRGTRQERLVADRLARLR